MVRVLNSGLLSRARRKVSALRLGFVPLCDCAPLVVAQEQGFFSRYGLNVDLVREVGWATVRDKIVHGQLDAAHALAAMPFAATLGIGSVATPCVTGLVLNLQGNAMLVDENDLPETGTTKNKVDNRPSPFVDPVGAIAKFRRQLPGEVGLRNVFRGDGYFNIDLSLSKAWSLGIADHRLRFRWDVFNVTNTAKFDVGQLTNTPDISGFGRYNGTLATCDAQAGRCMQFAMRYEF